MLEKVLVTGANGFVGWTLCPALEEAGFAVRGSVRKMECWPGAPADMVAVGRIGSDTDWDTALEGVDVVVHLAGRAHVLSEKFKDPLAQFHRVNVLGTERLALAAARAGVRRFVYASSIGVNGRTTPGRAFTEENEPAPHNPYAYSKWEAEQTLRGISARSDLEVVILRPPLIYGPGVKANFLRLMELADSGFPLPLGSIDNCRSLLYVGNMAGAVVKCLQAPEAAGETFLLSDGEDVSSPDLIRRIGWALGNAPRVVPFPPSVIRTSARMIGRVATVEPLLDSLMVNGAKIRNLLGWRPSHGMDHGLRETARWFKNGRNRKRKSR